MSFPHRIEAVSNREWCILFRGGAERMKPGTVAARLAFNLGGTQIQAVGSLGGPLQFMT
jgi:hypothetical protein